MKRAWSPTTGAIVLTAILVLGSLLAALGATPAAAAPASSLRGSPAASYDVSVLRSEPLAPVADSEPGLGLTGAIDGGPSSVATLTIFVSFPIPREAALQSFLASLSDPSSPQYHHYLTAAQFDAEFGGSPDAYETATSFFQSFGVTHLETFGDRLSLSFVATPSEVDQIFHTTIDQYTLAGQSYSSPDSTPELPASLAGAIESVEGLSTYSALLNHPDSFASLVQVPPIGYRLPTSPSTGYLPPATYDGAQLEYAPDFQVAYDEQSLFNDSGFPTNAVIATILWTGVNDSDEPVAPFVPSDIYAFYNETIPSGEPHAHVYGVPQDGALPPGPSASWDETGAYVENTLDLEMAGSTAPGASIYNVYGPSADSADLDGAFSYILDPTGTPGLANVNVISNSWGGEDVNDSGWYTDVMEAQTRGITVLASSGDSGDYPGSPKGVGGPDDVEFPSAMAYDDFGVVAVGGTTVTLDPTPSSSMFLHLVAQTAWDEPSSEVGSTGGVSLTFNEPSWQLDTSAATVISDAGDGTGRATPDIGAIANNTLVTISIDGHQYVATNASHGGEFEYLGGTSVASPLEAGIVAEIDHVLAAHSNGPLGFLDPVLYSLANTEFSALGSTSTTGYIPTGTYSSPLPTLPLLDVTTGGNDLYAALPGYDLVTGWGSPDAYNYTMYVLTLSSAGVFGRLSAVQDNLTLSNLAVTSEGGSYSASIQQNFFLANSLGAPVYWIQNVIYIDNETDGWEMTYTGWVVYPFYGLYPAETVYEYNFPSSGLLVHLPSNFDVATYLETPTGFDTQYVEFFVGAHEVDLPVPGASYIIGTLGYNYSWQGVNYTNGPFPDNPTPGGLSPQFGLVGGPSGGDGIFTSPTGGKLSVTLEPFGTASFVAAATESFGENIDQTGETASNLEWTQANENNWTLGIESGSGTQGVLGYEPVPNTVSFSEAGLPSGTRWSVTLNGVQESTTGTTLMFPESTGSFPYSIAAVSGWYQSTLPYTGTVVVSGTAVNEPTLEFERVTYPVTFSESGLPVGETWYVNFTSGPSGFTLPSGSALAGGTIVLDLFNGSYQYTVASDDRAFSATSPDSLSESAGVPGGVGVTFSFGSAVEFSESGLPLGTNWAVTLDGERVSSNSATLVIYAPNGSDPYTIGAISGWHQSTLPYNGVIVVAGAPLTEPTLAFYQVTYSVTFTETGLPTGTEWWLNVTGQAALASVSDSISFTEPNGTYEYTLNTTDKLYASPGGSFTVNGGSVSKTPAFSLVTYSVTFTESALPPGTGWYVNITGGASEEGLGTAIGFSEPNGTYDFTVSTPDPTYAPSSVSGTFTVDGGPVSETVSFYRVTYAVTFVESGLPTGTLWSVTLGGNRTSSTTTSITVDEPNGTYSYVVTDVAGWHQTTIPYAGAVAVSGAPVTEPTLQFSSFTYAGSFTESGLPAGTEWWVNFTGGPSLSSTSTSLAFSEPNGTFGYTVSTTDKEFAAVGGSVTVEGALFSQTVQFLPVTYTITFTESGLPSGTVWSVTIDGETHTSTNATVTFLETNGTYSFRVGSVSGFTVAPGSGSIPLSGSSLDRAIVFTATPNAATFLGLPALEGYALLGAIALVVVGTILALVYRRRRYVPPSSGAPPTP